MAKPTPVLAEVAQAMAEAARMREQMNEQPTHYNLDDARARRLQARRIEALTLRLAGLSPDQIAERLQIQPDSVQDLIARTLDRAQQQGIEQYRALENARLDRAQAAIWGQVIAGDLRAVSVFLGLSARRSRMNGWDAPASLTINTSIRMEMEQALNELQQVMGEAEAVRDEPVPGPDPDLDPDQSWDSLTGIERAEPEPEAGDGTGQ